MKLGQLLSLILILSTSACGKLASQTQNGLNTQAGTLVGIMLIPKQNTVGGAISVQYNNGWFELDYNNSSISALNYISQLYVQTLPVTPISQTATDSTYRIRYNATFGSGPCVNNPTTTCPIAAIQSITAY